MAKRKQSTNGKAATAEVPALPEGCEWRTIRVPYYTGELDHAADHRIQATLLSVEERDGWQRFHKAMCLIHRAEREGHMLSHAWALWDKTSSQRFLYESVAKAQSGANAPGG